LFLSASVRALSAIPHCITGVVATDKYTSEDEKRQVSTPYFFVFVTYLFIPLSDVLYSRETSVRKR